jgi:hypothetical protein
VRIPQWIFPVPTALFKSTAHDISTADAPDRSFKGPTPS